MKFNRLCVVLILSLGTSQFLGAQERLLRVEREGRPVVTLTARQLQELPSDTLSRSSHGAPPVRYRAVKLVDVLAAAGSPVDSLSLGHAGWIVATIASDGYVAVFSAGELDPKLATTRAWLALDRDGQPLAQNEAPFRVIVASDSHDSRSARQVTAIRIFDALRPTPRP